MVKEIWQAFWLFILAIIAYLLKYLLNVLLANYLPAHYYGDVSIAIRCLTFVSAFILLGSTLSANRFLSQYIRNHDTNSIRHYIRWNLKLLSYSFTLCIILALVSFGIMVLIQYLNLYNIEDYHVAVHMLWVAPVFATALLIASYISCYNFPIISYALQNIGQYVFLLVLFFISAILLKLSFKPYEIIFIFLLAFTMLAALEVFFLVKKIPHALTLNFKSLNDIDLIKRKEWLRFSSRLILSNMIYVLSTILDLFLVELFSPSENDVGYYSAVLVITGLVWIVPQGIYQIIKGQISALIETVEGKKELQKKLNAVTSVLFFISFILVMLILFFSDHLLLHFGRDYLIAKDALLITLFGTFVGIFSQSGAVLLTYGGHEKCMLWINISELTTLMLLGIPLTWQYSIVGISIAFVIALSIKTIAVIYYCKKNLAIKSIGFI